MEFLQNTEISNSTFHTRMNTSKISQANHLKSQNHFANFIAPLRNLKKFKFDIWYPLLLYPQLLPKKTLTKEPPFLYALTLGKMNITFLSFYLYDVPNPWLLVSPLFPGKVWTLCSNSAYISAMMSFPGGNDVGLNVGKSKQTVEFGIIFLNY